MYTYRSKCRWGLLLFINGNIVEIHPGELFTSKVAIDIKYLEEVKSPKPKKGRSGYK